MPEVIVIEVACDPALYSKVNEKLGLDPATGSGDWPEGLLSHLGSGSGGGGGDGKVVVVEVWNSRAQHEAWMSSKLVPAMGEAGVPQPSRMEWLTELGNFSR
jgi:hypothetical protein